MVETIPKKIHQILFLICMVYTLWYTCHMNEEIINRALQVFLYTGGIVAFWQITKHMPKALYTLLECISVMACSVLLLTPIAMIIEYILGGNIHTTMMFAGCLAGVGLLCGIWMVMVQSSRELQGKKQYQYVIL